MPPYLYTLVSPQGFPTYFPSLRIRKRFNISGSKRNPPIDFNYRSQIQINSKSRQSSQLQRRKDVPEGFQYISNKVETTVQIEAQVKLHKAQQHLPSKGKERGMTSLLLDTLNILE
jgi:site-specific DNA-cytosine methylase